MTTLTRDDPMASAVALGSAIRASADEAERNRRLPKSIIDAMTKAGIFRMFVPRSHGGLEQPLADSMRVFEELSRSDASAGWVAMILGSNAVIARQLDDATVQELFGPNTLTSGIVAPLGRADIVEGGYRLTGRWPFGSGCQESPWMSAGAMAWENGTLRMLPNGMPDWRLFAFPASDAEIIDTWHVSGLRATGSHDIAASDIFVPANRVISIVEDEPTRQGPLYAFPVLALFGAVVASVALGAAQRAMDEITELAATKVPAGATTPLAEQATAQRAIAQAASELASGRAFLFEAVADMWETVSASASVAPAQRARVRMAASQAVTCAARAVDAAYYLGGSSSIRDSSALQRCFRDVHAITQHLIVGQGNYDLAGRIMLGQDISGMLV